MNTIINQNSDFINYLEEKILNKKQKKEKDMPLEIDAKKLKLSDKQKEILTSFAKSRTSQECIRERAMIILLYLSTSNKALIARVLKTYWEKINKWTKKFCLSQERLKKIESEEPHNLKKEMIKTLSDNYRKGRPPRITTLQVASIIFISLQSPNSYGVPISHWSSKSLTSKVIELNIVDTISERQVSRYLKQMDINLYRYKGWLNSKEKNENFGEFQSKINILNNLYRDCDKLREQGVIVTCSDEKMSIQALEHKYEKKPAQIGSLEKVEQEYKRQGVTGIIATRDVTTGKIIVSDIQPTRNEIDFLNHVKQIIGENTGVKRILIMDQLNTHMSESLVKYIAECCNIKIDLGVKGVSGILKSKKTRKTFLEDITHNIRIVYTPKHTSWMNQIEIWFGIITKQLLNKRSSFKTVEELENKIREYILYYNDNLAKPFKWNHGKILSA